MCPAWPNPEHHRRGVKLPAARDFIQQSDSERALLGDRSAIDEDLFLAASVHPHLNGVSLTATPGGGAVRAEGIASCSHDPQSYKKGGNGTDPETTGVSRAWWNLPVRPTHFIIGVENGFFILADGTRLLRSCNSGIMTRGEAARKRRLKEQKEKAAQEAYRQSEETRARALEARADLWASKVQPPPKEERDLMMWADVPPEKRVTKEMLEGLLRWNERWNDHWQDRTIQAMIERLDRPCCPVAVFVGYRIPVGGGWAKSRTFYVPCGTPVGIKKNAPFCCAHSIGRTP